MEKFSLSMKSGGLFNWSPIVTFVCVFCIFISSACNEENNSGPAFEDLGFFECSRPDEGCSCSPGRIAACYPDQPLLDDLGNPYCIEGLRYCGEDGRWGECTYPEDPQRFAIMGEPELCGGCDPTCFRVHDCPTGRDLSEDNADNVRFDVERDGIVLGGKTINARYAYIANSGDGQVSKIDLTSRQVVGQYRLGYSPSRTAIDSRGNAYVAHRSAGGYVSKIAGDESYCVDRNMNGTIETSTSRTPLPNGTIDECVLWDRKIVAHARSSWSGFRAVTVDRLNRVWLGEGDWSGYGDQYFHILDPESGSPVHDPVSINFQAYGAAISGDGTLWLTTRGNEREGSRGYGAHHIQSINTDTFTPGPAIFDPLGSHYGIAVDREGRVWIANWGWSYVSRYDPARRSWMHVYVPGRSRVRGVTLDGEGRIWTSCDNAAISFDPETGGDQRVYPLSGCGTAIGIGADFDEKIWVSCYSSNNTIWLDPATGDTESITTGSRPYTYSDFTGFLRATVTSPEGSYTRLYDSRVVCTGDTESFWSQLYWNVETPDGTEVNFWARTADRVEQLGLSPQMLVASVPGEITPAELQSTLESYGVENHKRYMEVRVELRSEDGETSPVFRNMDTVFYCECNCDVDEGCSSDCDCDEDC